MLEGVRATLDALPRHMDQFFSERALHESGEVQAAHRPARRHVYEHDGALWLRTSAHGDDKDRVLRRSNGELDLLRLRHRLPRGQARARLRPRDRRLGRRPSRPRRAHEGRLGGAGRRPGRLRDHDHAAGQPHRGRRARADVEARAARSSRSTTCSTTSASTPRAGSCSRSHDTTLDLDLELARSESQDNPVYYVQYAHARIASHPAQGGRGAGGSGARRPT